MRIICGKCRQDMVEREKRYYIGTSRVGNEKVMGCIYCGNVVYVIE